MGERIGAFELGEQIGAGGMGRVYRARDPRLGRDVAIKVIADEVRSDPERLRRFESEARAIAALTHPNVMAIHDVGSHDGAPYLVCELLDGETLRDRMDAGPLAWRKAVELAKQIAAGLAAVHAAGIVHRDLKPGNVFVTRAGHVKLLDFGVARVAKVPEGDSTIDGAVIGTAGYMAPEQVRGEPADARVDIFALGAVLYELLAGKKAFDGATEVERGYAVLKAEPADLPPTVPAPLARVVRRCLEKRRDERFESARDLGFALEALLDTSATAPPTVAGPRRRRWLLVPMIGLALGGAASAGFLLRSTSSTPISASNPPPKFELVTFRRGHIEMARFASDPGSIVYSASWNGEGYATYLGLRGHPDARTLHANGLTIVGLASSGELLLREHPGDWFLGSMLFRVSLAGGAPRPVLERVIDAEMIPGTDELAATRNDGTRYVLEFPVGRPVLDSHEAFDYMRVSRDGQRVAVSVIDNGMRTLMTVDRRGERTILATRWADIQGLAWSPDGREVWLAGRRSEGQRGTWTLYAIDLAGQVRELVSQPGTRLVLHDVALDGRVLLSWEQVYRHVFGHRSGDTVDHELSWFDRTSAVDLSASGDQVLFNESGDAAGKGYSMAYVRRIDGAPAVKLMDSWADALSPDGAHVLVYAPIPIDASDQPEEMWIIPAGPGNEKRVLPRGPIHRYMDGAFFPDGRRVVLLASEAGPRRAFRIYIQDIAKGEPRAVTPPDTTFPNHSNPVSPDGAWVFAADAKTAAVRLYPVAGGESRALPGLKSRDVPLRWSNDGRVLVLRVDGRDTSVVAVDTSTGAAERVVAISPPDATGVTKIENVLMTPDAKTYVYSYVQRLSRLYIVEGLR